MSPASHRQLFAIAAGKRPCVFAVLVVLWLTVGVARAAGINPDQLIRLDGMELFFGIVPAEILCGHPGKHEEQTKHGGVPRDKGVHHSIISVVDASTRARITDAAVTPNLTAGDLK